MGFDANGDTIQATKAAAAVRKITIEETQTADFEDNDFSGKRSLMESVERRPKTLCQWHLNLNAFRLKA